MTTQDLRREAKRRLQNLSAERVKVANDFLAYLEERESNEATRELLETPGLIEAIERAEKSAKARRLIAWRRVRDDV